MTEKHSMASRDGDALTLSGRGRMSGGGLAGSEVRLQGRWDTEEASSLGQ